MSPNYLVYVFLRETVWIDCQTCNIALAEAGIIRSKLSGRSSRTSLSDLDGEGCMNFCPDRYVKCAELCIHLSIHLPSPTHDRKNLHLLWKSYFWCNRFVSRQDLISWKVNVEYEVRPGITEEVGKQLQLITCCFLFNHMKRTSLTWRFEKFSS